MNEVSQIFFFLRELKTDSLSLLKHRAQVTASLTSHPVYTGRVTSALSSLVGSFKIIVLPL